MATEIPRAHQVHLRIGARHVRLGQSPLLRAVVEGEALPAPLGVGLQVDGDDDDVAG